MAYAAYNYTITDESGNVVTGCSIEVRRESDNALVPLYSDRSGALAISNPFTDSTGTGRFHAAGSAYKITASKTGFSRSFRFVPIGLAGETDFTVGTFFGVWDAAATYPLGGYVIYNDVGIFISAIDENLNNAPDSATPGSTADWAYYPGIVGPQGDSGLIGTWEGPWVTGTVYSLNDAVSQGGSSYICIVSHTSGTFSTDLAADKWELVAQKGDTGAAGVDGTGLFTRVRVVDTTGAAVATDYENGDTIDDVVLATNDLVLRATSGGNAADGVYVVPASGAASRASAFDTYDEHPGVYISVMEGTANADKLWRCTSNKGGTLGSTALVFSEFSAGGGGGGDVTNLGLAITVGSSAMTIALKQANGSTDPAIGTGAVKAKMRSSTLATGAVIERSATSALSLVIPSTATMGRTNGLVGHLYHYLIDNAGTLELAVSGGWFGKAGIITTTTIDAGSDSGNVMYSTTGRSNVPFICIGRSIDTQTTAGTWAAVPSTVEIDPKVRFPVAFSANRTSNQTIATSTATKVQFDNEENDVGGFYDNATNYRFQPPAGVYLVGASVHLSTGADGSFLDGMIYKNGAYHKVLGRIRFPGAVSNSVSGAARVIANGTDYFELFVFHNVGSPADVYADAPFSFWWGQSVEEY
jgi:hypothetical protein